MTITYEVSDWDDYIWHHSYSDAKPVIEAINENGLEDDAWAYIEEKLGGNATVTEINDVVRFDDYFKDTFAYPEYKTDVSDDEDFEY